MISFSHDFLNNEVGKDSQQDHDDNIHNAVGLAHERGSFFEEFLRFLHVLQVFIQILDVDDDLLMHHPDGLTDGHRIVVEHAEAIQNVVHLLLYTGVDVLDGIQYLFLLQGLR